MHNKWLHRVNTLLGAAVVGLMGCRAQNVPVEVKYGPFQEPKKYGPPPELVRPPQAPEENVPDTLVQPPVEQPEPQPQEPEPVVCMYGIPVPEPEE